MKIINAKVIFEWRSSAKNVSIGSDFNNYRFEPLIKKRDNYWIIEKTLPIDGRFDYIFLVDGTFVLDPENPFTQGGGFGVKSELRMPKFSYPEHVYSNPLAPKGEISKKTIKDNFYGYQRELIFYAPQKDIQGNYLLVFQDGSDYIEFGSALNTLDNLIHSNRILPFFSVFVSVKKEKRSKEYINYKKYSNYLRNFIIPVSQEFFQRSFHNITLAGASLGGNVSLGTLKTFPDAFTSAISQSGAFLYRFPNFNNLRRHKIYLSLGKYETKVAGNLDIVKTNRKLKEMLEASAVQLKYQEFNDGHSFGNWKAHLGEALEFISEKMD